MVEVLELIMLVCFGLSWPIAVFKSIRSRSTKGKSLFFMVAIIIGYLSGIIGKIIGNQINFVLGVYCFNLLIVCTDLIIYFINKKRESTNSKIVA